MNLVLRKLHIDHIVDVGAGLGHLSRILSFQYNFKLATVDSVSSYAATAVDLDNEVLSSLKKSCTKHEVDDPENSKQNNNNLPCHLEGNITLNTSKEIFQKVLNEAWPEDSGANNIPFSFLGLHTCGDLASTLLKLFIEMPEARVLFSVGCCYMKLSDNVNGGYPLSNYLKKDAFSSLSYRAKELCCHALEGYIKKLMNGNSISLKIHCYRAILEKIIVDHHPTMKHIGLRSIKNAEKMTFADYAVRALSRCTLSIPEEAITSPSNNMLLKEWKKIVALYSLRLVAAPAIESLILIDRMLYLYENGYSSCVLPIFDPNLSPRNYVLMVCKDFQKSC